MYLNLGNTLFENLFHEFFPVFSIFYGQLMIHLFVLIGNTVIYSVYFFLDKGDTKMLKLLTFSKSVESLACLLFDRLDRYLDFYFLTRDCILDFDLLKIIALRFEFLP